MGIEELQAIQVSEFLIPFLYFLFSEENQSIILNRIFVSYKTFYFQSKICKVLLVIFQMIHTESHTQTHT